MLEVKNLAVSYGRHRALEGVSVKVDKGEICVILGANGAGKSTLLKAIAGMVHCEPGGEIAMNGMRITAMKPHQIVEQGIALVPEGRGIFGDLTVAENLQLGAFAGRARRSEAATLDFIYRLFPRLAERRRQVARTMSGGEQQMVAIGRALMSKPDILMLDEPSLGLSPLLTQELFRSLREIAASGVGILLVEQNAKQSLAIAGRGYLIENGAVTGENSAAALMRDPAVVNAYLGGAGRHAGRPSVTLPPPMRLPFDGGAIGDLMADLAARAGRIQAAFVRSLRQSSDLPSAFVGRYDPKAAGDPWTQFEQQPPRLAGASAKVPEDARRLGDQAAALARQASERLALHVRTARLSAPRPTAFTEAAKTRPPETGASTWRSDFARPDSAASAGPAPASPPAISHGDMAELAARAAERSAAFLRARRLAAPQPSAFAALRNQEEPRPQPGRPAGLVGHARAGVDAPSDPAPAAQASAPRDELAELAARAAERSAAFLRARRLAAPQPAAFARKTAKSEPDPILAATAIRARPARPEPAKPAERPNGSHGLIGHNSGGLDLAEEDAGGGPAFSIAELAARAASIHASHVAERRKGLTAFVIPAASAKADGKGKTPGKSHSKDSAKKKRKKHKEA